MSDAKSHPLRQKVLRRPGYDVRFMDIVDYIITQELKKPHEPTDVAFGLSAAQEAVRRLKDENDAHNIHIGTLSRQVDERNATITTLCTERDRLTDALRRVTDFAANPPKLMLPPIASKWHGGFYVGIVRGLHVDHHLIQLRANAPNQYCGWGAAAPTVAIDGRLPTPNEASLLYANGMLEGEKNLVWTSAAAGHNHALAINPQNGEISTVNKTLSLAWTSVKTVQV